MIAADLDPATFRDRRGVRSVLSRCFCSVTRSRSYPEMLLFLFFVFVCVPVGFVVLTVAAVQVVKYGKRRRVDADVKNNPARRALRSLPK